MKTKTMPILGMLLLAFQLNAQIYQVDVTSVDQEFTSDIIYNRGATSNTVAVLRDSFGLEKGLYDTISLIINPGSNITGSTIGALFEGKSTKYLNNVGNIGATIDVNSITSSQLVGLETRYTNQALGSNISSHIKVVGINSWGVRMEASKLGSFTSDSKVEVTNLGSGSAYGIAVGLNCTVSSLAGSVDLLGGSGMLNVGLMMNANAHVGHIEETARINASGVSGCAGIYLMSGGAYTASLGNIAGDITARSDAASAGIINTGGSVGDILSTATISAKSNLDSSNYNFIKSGGIVTDNDIGTIYGKVSYEINNDTSLSGAINYTSAGTHNLVIGGNAEITGVNIGTGRGNSIYALGNVSISGDYEGYTGQQKLSGDMFSENGISVIKANIVVDNSESDINISTTTGNVSINDGATVEFVKKVNVTTGTFENDGAIILEARTLTDHASINLKGSTSASIGDTSDLLLILDNNFIAEAGDMMILFTYEVGSITGTFEDNFTVEFQNGTILLKDVHYTFDGEVLRFISDIPEPAEIAAFLGLLALGFARYHRRRN